MLPAEYMWVEEMIAENGREVTLVIPSNEPADPDKPWNGFKKQDTEIKQMGVFVPSYTAQKDFGLSLKEEDLLAECEQFVLFSGINRLVNARFIIDDGVKWRVVFLSELRPGKHELVYAVGVKR